MQPNNPLDPQNIPPVPPTPPIEPQPAPAPQPVAPAPAPQPLAPQPAPVAPVDPLAQAPQPGQVPSAMPGTPAPAPLGSMPGGPEAPKSGFLDKLKANKKLLIKVAIIVAIVIVLVVGVVVAARFLPSNPVTNFLTGTKGVSLEQYDSSGLDFTMDVPKDWKIDEDADSDYYKYVTFREPAAELKDESEAAKHTASISVTLSDNSSSDIFQKEEDEYFDNVKKSIKAGIDAAEDRDEDNPAKFEILSDEDTEINGHKAYKVKVKASNFENEKDQVGYGTFLYVYVSKDYQYSITLSAHEADKGFVDKMDAIVASFKSTK